MTARDSTCRYCLLSQHKTGPWFSRPAPMRPHHPLSQTELEATWLMLRQKQLRQLESTDTVDDKCLLRAGKLQCKGSCSTLTDFAFEFVVLTLRAAARYAEGCGAGKESTELPATYWGGGICDG